MNPQANMLINFIVNPGKSNYNMSELGPKVPTGSNPYTREDFKIPITRNGKSINLECSLYLLKTASPCIIYMHGNASCRVEGYSNIITAQEAGCHMMVFDFAGTGKSGGDFISLGYFEQDDLNTIIMKLQENKLITKFILWGRSMGSATTLLYTTKYKSPCVCGIICDSSFTDLLTQMSEMADMFISPTSAIFESMKKFLIDGLTVRIIKEYNFDIKKLRPIDGIENLTVPALILQGNQDGMIRPHHGKELYEKYGSNAKSKVLKKLLNFDCDHNDPRPSKVKAEIVSFIKAL